MKRIIYLLLVLGLAACEQGVPKATIDLDIHNKKTPKHINIPGTRLYMIPPENGTIAKGFVGIQLADKGGIQVFDLVGGSFYTNGATFNREGFEQQGVKVLEYKEFKVNGYPAKIVAIQGDASNSGYSILFGDSTFSATVIGNYTTGDAVTEKQIVAALNSIYYDANKKIDPFDTAPFEREVNDSKFMFNQYVAGQYIFTEGGTDHKGEGGYSPAVVAMKVPLDAAATLEGIAETLTSKLVQHGMINAEYKNMHPGKINDRDSYETELYGELNGEKVVCYVCVINGVDYGVVLNCLAKRDLEKNLAAFKQFARGLQIK